jgi:hypothetical protein
LRLKLAFLLLFAALVIPPALLGQSGDAVTAPPPAVSTPSPQASQPDASHPKTGANGQTPLPGSPGDRIHYDTQPASAQGQNTPAPSYGQQPKRIMGWIPNYRAVSVDAKLPPPSMREKFRIAYENSFDYSAFIFNAVDVEFPYIEKSYPEFGNGWSGYGQYYWHGFVDKAIGNYMTDAFVPTLTHEDSRYYTLGRGHWYVRAIYAYTRVLITPNDEGQNTFNFSEIVGKGAAAGLGNLYYPARYATWTKTGQRWLVQVAIRDGGFNVFREFWPDIATHILHQHGQVGQ